MVGLGSAAVARASVRMPSRGDGKSRPEIPWPWPPSMGRFSSSAPWMCSIETGSPRALVDPEGAGLTGDGDKHVGRFTPTGTT